eukprot:Seg2298.3 transcript_id=Seg2298.3/GoldUCD/mRNA.D3Y31 product="hypothetical protein" protein_id=Seg2298.3/GoldUCD/D3Y31
MIQVLLESAETKEHTGFLVLDTAALDHKLKEIKKEIYDQINELMPQHFAFLLGNIPISEKQEDVFKLRMVAKEVKEQEQLLDMRMFTVRFRSITKSSPVVAFSPVHASSKLETQSFSDMPSLSFDEGDDASKYDLSEESSDVAGDNEVGDTLEVGTASEMEFESMHAEKKRKLEPSTLSFPDNKVQPKIVHIDLDEEDRPTTSSFVQKSILADKCDKAEEPYYAAKARGLKIYSVEEIQRAKSSDKAYLQFWNEKTVALCRDPKYHKYPRLAIEGVLNASWTKRKVTLLREDVQQLQLEINNLKQSFPEEKELPTMRTVGKNINRMMIARNAINIADSEVQRLANETKSCFNRETNIKLSSQLKAAQSRVEASYTELKKAQDALRKSLKSEAAKLSAAKERIQMSRVVTFEPPEITIEEENDLAKEIEEEKDFEPE